MIIDVHSHCNFNAYLDDYKEVIEDSLNNNVGMIMVGSQFSSSERAAKLAQEYKKNVYASIGLHPVHQFATQIDEDGQKFKTKAESFDEEAYQDLLDKYDNIVAIGEIGLDYHWFDKNDEGVKEVQYTNLKKQLNFAYKNNLPVIIHCRAAHDDMISVLQNFTKDKPKKEYGVIHGYYGSYNKAMAYIEAGFLISFTGIITYNSSCDKLIKRLPADKILVETDCPYLTPEPHKGERNVPKYIWHTLEKMSLIRKVSNEEMTKICMSNAKRLFNID